MDITNLNYAIQKYNIVLNKINEILQNVHKGVYETHFKDKVPKSSIFCTVCVVNNSSHAIVPCGHIFCGGCIETLGEKNECPSCRVNIQSTIKLYNLDEVGSATLS